MNDERQLELFDVQPCAVQPVVTPCVSDDVSFRDYDKAHCWQYDIRCNNLTQDIIESGLTADRCAAMTLDDFTFRLMTTDEEKEQAIEFIKRHEWLGTISQYTTHWFGAYYHDPTQGLFGKNILAAVILMNIPNTFSKMLGDDQRIERLISRGACISWSPKCLASKMMMWCINYMVQNTEFRLFTAYSDPAAKELGTIYQACNFYYLGKRFGTSLKYVNPYTGKVVSDRFFRSKSAYKRYAKELGIKWVDTWSSGDTISWEKIPESIEQQLRAKSRATQASSEVIQSPQKHKYAYVLGRCKRETKALRKRFLEANKTYPYPSERGK